MIRGRSRQPHLSLSPVHGGKWSIAIDAKEIAAKLSREIENLLTDELMTYQCADETQDKKKDYLHFVVFFLLLQSNPLSRPILAEAVKHKSYEWLTTGLIGWETRQTQDESGGERKEIRHVYPLVRFRLLAFSTDIECISSSRSRRSFTDNFILVRHLIKRIMSILSNYINYFISSLEFKTIDTEREHIVINDTSVEKSIFYPARFAWRLSSREWQSQDMMEHEWISFLIATMITVDTWACPLCHHID